MSELQDTAGHLVVAGRGKVIADTSVTGLIAAASGNRITLRTTAPADAMTALADAGAEVAATGSGVLTISGLSSDRVVATLAGHAIPFSEVTAHRATLEHLLTVLGHLTIVPYAAGLHYAMSGAAPWWQGCRQETGLRADAPAARR